MTGQNQDMSITMTYLLNGEINKRGKQTNKQTKNGTGMVLAKSNGQGYPSEFVSDCQTSCIDCWEKRYYLKTLD